MKYYIDSHIILGRKIGPLVYLYIMIIIVIMLSLIIFLFLFHYKTFYTLKGNVLKTDDDYYIRLCVPIDDIKNIFASGLLRIDKKNYSFNVISIDSEYLSDNYTTYQIILIKVDIPKKYRFNNLNLNLQFLKDNKRVIDYIIRR